MTQNEQKAERPRFVPGRNIAMKIPPHEFDRTVAFYRDILGLAETTTGKGPSCRFAFGDKLLWLDPVATLSQAETWLEIVADDIDAAARYLQQQGCTRCDHIEPLPEGFRGFWITSPANIIHLVCEQET